MHAILLRLVLSDQHMVCVKGACDRWCASWLTPAGHLLLPYVAARLCVRGVRACFGGNFPLKGGGGLAGSCWFSIWACVTTCGVGIWFAGKYGKVQGVQCVGSPNWVWPTQQGWYHTSGPSGPNNGYGQWHGVNTAAVLSTCCGWDATGFFVQRRAFGYYSPCDSGGAQGQSVAQGRMVMRLCTRLTHDAWRTNPPCQEAWCTATHGRGVRSTTMQNILCVMYVFLTEMLTKQYMVWMLMTNSMCHYFTRCQQQKSAVLLVLCLVAQINTQQLCPPQVSGEAPPVNGGLWQLPLAATGGMVPGTPCQVGWC